MEKSPCSLKKNKLLRPAIKSHDAFAPALTYACYSMCASMSLIWLLFSVIFIIDDITLILLDIR